MENNNPYEPPKSANDSTPFRARAATVAKAAATVALIPLAYYGASLGLEGAFLLNDQLEGRANPGNLSRDINAGCFRLLAASALVGAALGWLVGLVVQFWSLKKTISN